MKKRIVSICLVVALAAIAITGASLAYFTADDSAENVFTVGNVKIDLTEPNWDAEGAEEAKEMYPGEAVKKDPTVTNTGANPCFVRVKVTFPESPVVTYRTDYVDDKLGENWVEYDGYYYYTKVLEADAMTDALFDQIVLGTDTVNGDATTEYKIPVKAEAVQAQGAKTKWADVQKMTVEEIAAWFATCMA